MALYKAVCGNMGGEKSVICNGGREKRSGNKYYFSMRWVLQAQAASGWQNT